MYRGQSSFLWETLHQFDTGMASRLAPKKRFICLGGMGPGMEVSTMLTVLWISFKGLIGRLNELIYPLRTCLPQ